MPPTVNFHFEKGQKLPAGFEDLKIGQIAELTVKGKVESLNQSQSGSGVSLKIDSVTIERRPKRRPFV